MAYRVEIGVDPIEGLRLEFLIRDAFTKEPVDLTDKEYRLAVYDECRDYGAWTPRETIVGSTADGAIVATSDGLLRLAPPRLLHRDIACGFNASIRAKLLVCSFPSYTPSATVFADIIISLGRATMPRITCDALPSLPGNVIPFPPPVSTEIEANIFDFILDATLRQQIVTRDPACPDVCSLVQTAIDQATSRNVALSLCGGTFPLGQVNDEGGLLKLRSGTVLNGTSRSLTTLRQMSNVNARDILATDKATLVWMSPNEFTKHGKRCTMRRLTVDGNKANNAPSTDTISSAALRIYGLGHLFEDLMFLNVPGKMIATGYRGDNISAYYQSLDGSSLNDFNTIQDIYSSSVGMQGLHVQFGPTDMHIRNFWAVDCGQYADNTYAAFHNESGNFRADQIHAFSSQYVYLAAQLGQAPANQCGRMAYAFRDDGGGCDITNSHFEGAYNANVLFNANGTQLRNCRAYNKRGPTAFNVLFRNSGNTYAGVCLPSNGATDGSGGSPNNAITLGLAGDFVTQNTVDIKVDNTSTGRVLDSSYSSGLNYIKVRGEIAASDTLFVNDYTNLNDELDVNILLAGKQYKRLQQPGTEYSGIAAAGTTANTATALGSINFARITSGTGGVLLPPAFRGLQGAVANATGAPITAYVGAAGNYIDYSYTPSIAIPAGKAFYYHSIDGSGLTGYLA